MSSGLQSTKLDTHSSAPLPNQSGPYDTGKAGSEAREAPWVGGGDAALQFPSLQLTPTESWSAPHCRRGEGQGRTSFSVSLQSSAQE